MMYAQQHDVMSNKEYGIKMTTTTTTTRSMPISEVEEPQLLDVLDLSGMSLDSLPNPSINLALICKLDLSNNNLQVIHFIYSYNIYLTNMIYIQRNS